MYNSILALQKMSPEEAQRGAADQQRFSTISWVNCNGWGASSFSSDNCH
ncbi:hypothetical protein BFL35_00120 [Clavibacter michiganensis]|uniref:Uncharacterized protein n=1 Tax=Clavibacter michiganensis TaxID=28447 RepID=A0A251Z7W2_9MICO|nr:SapB/AmfS family lanthipeptide [Clavibacter michiganensis]OUE20399.1 hypothetical protein BFL34_01214 [Clavibacter michiganensis]OUE32408.1 hypothetical protein BFL35_00120 [Clavibacter michiganensis]